MPETSLSNSAASSAAAQAGPLPNTTAFVASIAPASAAHARATLRPSSTCSGRRASALARAGSDVSFAHTPSAATTLPQNAWVWVTARWWATATSAHAPARDPIVEPGVEVTAAYGAGAPPSIASIRSRNSPDEETARSTSPGRHANASRASSPLGTARTSGPCRPSSDASQSARQT